MLTSLKILATFRISPFSVGLRGSPCGGVSQSSIHWTAPQRDARAANSGLRLLRPKKITIQDAIDIRICGTIISL
ncbi:MAG: hypothetical protein LBU65_15010 [Planctomycetaceae bacterium]|nr:hypothetical protein [Planctomycetaceae bacterium]